MGATIHEVARRAGVSAATVSRVYNRGSVSAEKERLVLRAAADLSFVPNRTARSLRRRSSELIALIIPDIENQYFTSLARGVEDAALARGYSTVFCNTDDDVDKEARYLSVVVSENMAGVIIATASSSSDLSSLIASGRHIVAVDRLTNEDVDRVTTDDLAAGRRATEELIRHGFRRIACITGQDTIPTSHERARGWRSALADAGLPAPDSALRFSDFRVEGGRQAMQDLLSFSEPPDAVVVTNNLMGVGVLQALHADKAASDVRIGVIGELPYVTSDALAATVRLPVREMGETALKILMERIDGDTSPAKTIVLQNELVPSQPPRTDEHR